MDLSISHYDAGIVIVYMLATMAFGIWMGRGQVSTRDYFLGGRSLPWWALLISIVATETSTVTFLSVPGITFDLQTGNFFFLQFALGLVLGRFLVVLLLMPGYFRGELLTAYQLLHQRFGSEVKWLASALFLITRNLADGLRLYLTAIVLTKVTGLDMLSCIAILGVITIIYTMLGGMRSVVWNDCIQFTVYMLGGVWALAMLIHLAPGGWSEFIAFGQEHHSFRMWDWRFDPRISTTTVGSGVLGGAILCLGTHGADQMMVQRYLGARSFRDASAALIGSGGVVFLQFALFLLIGVALARFYSAYPPEVPFTAADEVFASFIVNHLGLGVVGITLAAVFSAAMSTLSSSLNASASAWVNDFYVGRLASQKDAATDNIVQADESALHVSRLATIVFGLIQMSVAAIAIEWAVDRNTVYLVLKIAGFTMGPILGLFLLANFVRSAGKHSALSGFAAGVMMLSIVEICIQWDIIQINSFYYTAIGMVTTVVVGWLIAWLIPRVDSLPVT